MAVLIPTLALADAVMIKSQNNLQGCSNKIWKETTIYGIICNDKSIWEV